MDPKDITIELKEKLNNLLGDAVFGDLDRHHHNDDEGYFFAASPEDLVYLIENGYMTTMLIPAIIDVRYFTKEEKVAFLDQLYAIAVREVSSNFFINAGFPFHKCINYLMKTQNLNWNYLAGAYVKDEYSDPQDFEDFSANFFNNAQIDWQYKVIYFLIIPFITERISTRRRYLILKEIIKSFFTAEKISLIEKSQTALLFINNELNIQFSIMNIVKNWNIKGVDSESVTPGEWFIFELVNWLYENQEDSTKKALNEFILKKVLPTIILDSLLLEAVLREITKQFIFIQENEDASQIIKALCEHENKYVKLGVIDALFELKDRLQLKVIIKMLERIVFSADPIVRSTAFEYLFVLADDIKEYLKASLSDENRKVRETIRRVALSGQKFAHLSSTRRKELLYHLENSGIPLSPKQKFSFLKFNEKVKNKLPNKG